MLSQRSFFHISIQIVPKLDILEGGRKDIVFDPTFNKDFTSLVQWIAEVSGL